MLVERDHIGIFGKMNSGKSTLMNLLTQQETSIVDSTPGTTADTKITLQEIHGMGPVKLFDTAGLDEGTSLGEKKRKKVLATLKECDLVLLIIDPSTGDFETETMVLEEARQLDKQLLVIYNLFQDVDEKEIARVERELPYIRFHHKLRLAATNPAFRQPLLEFILENFESKNQQLDLLPFVEKDQFYILNIPMDEETPQGRYLRPQTMAEEYITRHWAFPVSYRMDLGKARSGDRSERKRWNDFLASLQRRPKAIVTDSQAMDIMKDWAPDDMLLTTFSIMMINYVSRGKLNGFREGINALEHIKPGDRILIAEACNHSRIKEDIGIVQIPRYIEQHFPGVEVEHNFGREFQENKELEKYSLVIHCGGCMISGQKMQARIRDLEAIGVPFTNYGIFLSYIQGRKSLDRVMVPWK
ncbi:GTPase [Prolixibacter sp. SD074]|jgi:[FeFe] hydrogenase H-cluster maturation GTPase HydF|uniref:GTPase n=1 Tax=Prolixibacter sp. SD074 TaxID=2652391 RepID=UPI00127E7E92|nr:GTPase [Prolixibacter sp. SD074]GET30994.1 GTP-binding protein [Prolixibacter sp. SD074]